jgi:phosphoglycerol transferase
MTATRDDADVSIESPVPDSAEPRTVPDEQRRRRRRRAQLREGYWLIGVSAVSFAIALLVYQVWRANLHLPLGRSYDMRGVTAAIKGMRQHGWWYKNSNLGAPFGQDMRDFPSSGETTQMLALRLIVGVVRSPGLTVNIYFFGGFAVLAGVAFVVLRRLGLSAPVAAGLAVAYDFLPYHYFHGPDHLTRSTYLTAPLAVLLIVRLTASAPRFLRDSHAAVRRPWFGPSGSIRLRSLVGLLAIALFIGCTETMTTTFTVVLLVIIGLVAAIATGRISRLAFALLGAATVIGSFVLVNVPILWHLRSVGKNPIAGTRFAFESDIYGLRPSFMLLPTPAHWIGAFASAARTLLHGNPIPSEGGQAIGTLGVAGVLAALAILVVRALRSDSALESRRRRPLSPLTVPLATVILVAIVLGAGGATALDVVTGFVQVRTWNRIVVIIAFAAFGLTGLGLERVFTWSRARTHGPRARAAVTMALVVVVAGIGVLDGGRPPLANYKVVTAEWTSDLAFVAAMHTVQPPDGMIFQFPVIRFPESQPRANMRDYDQFRGYLADSGNFRWSYGAVKGRPQADWQLKLPAIPTAADLRALIGLGFTGLWANRDGYVDRGRAFEAGLRPLLGPPTLVSPNQRLAFYDLRPFASKIPAGTDLAAEAQVRFGIAPPKGT